MTIRDGDRRCYTSDADLTLSKIYQKEKTACVKLLRTNRMKKVFLNLLHLFTCKSESESPKQPSSHEESRQIGEKWSEVVSEKPKATLHHNFLSKEECEQLIKLAEQNLVYMNINTRGRAFFRRGSDNFLQDIEKRISDITSMPQENIKGFLISLAEVGEKCFPHYDTDCGLDDGNLSKATFLIYLSDVEEGGETHFPRAEGVLEQYKNVKKKGLLSITRRKQGLSIKPRMGDALLFWNLQTDNTLDPFSWHCAFPVKKGEKWLSHTTLHVDEYKFEYCGIKY